MKKAFVGIDLAIAKKKLLPVCVCVHENGKLTPLELRKLKHLIPRGFGNKNGLDSKTVKQFASDTLKFLSEIQKQYEVTIECIAIDAPSNFRLEAKEQRSAETAMYDSGISCFATPSRSKFEEIINKANSHLQEGGAENRIPHANQIWMLAGFALFKELKKYFKCIEVFPQAIARCIGASTVHKSKPEGYLAQLSTLENLTGWKETGLSDILKKSGFGARHDKLDAFMSAWIAFLFNFGKAKPLGNPPDDAIWIPNQCLTNLNTERKKL